MDVSTPGTGCAAAPHRSASDATRARALAEACAQLTQSRNPQSVFSALDQALGSLYGPERYALWHFVPPDRLERVDSAPPDADRPASAETVHRRLPRSAWEYLFARHSIALLADLPELGRGVEQEGARCSPCHPEALGIAIRDFSGLAGAVTLDLPPAGPAREEDVAFGRILGECATAALVCIGSVEREQVARSRLERMEQERQWQRAEIDRAETQKKQFFRDILCAVTNGKLTLCDREEIDQYWSWPCVSQPVRTESDVRRVRQAVTEAGSSVGLPDDRVQDLCLCASEAATNALKHAGSGEAAVTVTPSSVCVRVEDRGGGIDPFHLPRATLMKGYSTGASMGLGFTLMHELADHLYLTTSADGTTLIVEVALQPVSELDLILARLNLAE
jgi:anti-sigma regulatory factor (Ser/Thr protein kinase)